MCGTAGGVVCRVLDGAGSVFGVVLAGVGGVLFDDQVAAVWVRADGVYGGVL